MKQVLFWVSVQAVSMVASGVLQAQDNPFVGTWRLNVEQSKGSGVQIPNSEIRTVVVQGSGETVAYEGIRASGSPIAYSFTTNFDGKDSPISGTQPYGADTVAVKTVDANRHAFIAKKGGKTIFTTQTAVSKDGKVSTETTKGMNGDGVPISITMVWDKQ